jgi:hypothetical protein
MSPTSSTTRARRAAPRLAAALAVLASGALAATAAAEPWPDPDNPGVPAAQAFPLERAGGISLTAVTTHERGTLNGYALRGGLLLDGHRVGTHRVTCASAAGPARCSAVMTLPRGTLTVSFSRGARGGGTLTVAGGTGAYATATGGGTWRSLDRAGTRTAVVLRLR